VAYRLSKQGFAMVVALEKVLHPDHPLAFVVLSHLTHLVLVINTERISGHSPTSIPCLAAQLR
jgi:hypothetical protein